MATDQNHETYYVPEQSKLPIFASVALFLTVFGLANLFNSITAQKKAMASDPILEAIPFFNHDGILIAIGGFLLFVVVLYNWFAISIDENIRGLNSAQLKRSYVWGMGWFIFSEVMFFSAFFGALWYLRNISLPGLDAIETNDVLYNGEIDTAWPPAQTPDQILQGEEAKFTAPGKGMGWAGWGHVAKWLPFWNTIILLTSSVTVHIAHVALINDNKKKFNIWLGITVALGIIFLGFQAFEYYEAVAHYGIKLNSGAYGFTFFMLTGFHGLHVFMGTFMLGVQWLRSIRKGHFKHGDCFGFEASSWYWHFVDVVWVGLFVFVYILG